MALRNDDNAVECRGERLRLWTKRQFGWRGALINAVKTGFRVAVWVGGWLVIAKELCHCLVPHPPVLQAGQRFVASAMGLRRHVRNPVG